MCFCFQFVRICIDRISISSRITPACLHSQSVRICIASTPFLPLNVSCVFLLPVHGYLLGGQDSSDSCAASLDLRAFCYSVLHCTTASCEHGVLHHAQPPGSSCKLPENTQQHQEEMNHMPLKAPFHSVPFELELGLTASHTPATC